MAIIKSGATTDTLTVDPTSKAARSSLYDATGATIAKQDRAAGTPGTIQGLPIVNIEGKVAHVARGMADGSLADGRPLLMFNDPVEGAAVNTNFWTQTLTTMTVTQAAATGILFNAGSSVATTVGAMQTAQRLIPITQRTKITFRSKQRHTAHFNNNVIETGLIFSATPSATTTLIAQAASGAFWQKDGTGQYIPSLIVAGSVTAGTPISNATFLASVPATDYAVFEIEMDTAGAWFRILTVQGVVVNEQRVDIPTNTGDWAATHVGPMIRTYNTGGTGTAVQVFATEITSYVLDADTNKPWSHIQAGMGLNFTQSPTAFTQMANYVNVTAPTTRTPTNTTALEATLGGHVSWSNGANSFAANEGAASDLILFGFQIPVPYAFYCTGIRIDTVNLGAANGAAIYTIEYSMAVNSNAVSLATAAPNAPRFVPLGFSSLANAAAIGQTFSGPIDHTFSTPLVVQAGRFVHVVARVIGASAATASQVIRTTATVEGYFE